MSGELADVVEHRRRWRVARAALTATLGIGLVVAGVAPPHGTTPARWSEILSGLVVLALATVHAAAPEETA